MSRDQLSFADAFPPVAYERWREEVEQDLRGASYEQRLVSLTDDDIRVEPLYHVGHDLGSDAAGFPGAAPYARGSRALGVHGGWDIRECIASPDIEQAATQARQALAGGATSLAIELDAGARAGRDPDQLADLPAAFDRGIMLSHRDQLDRLLDGIDFDRTAIELDAGASALAAAALLCASATRTGISARQLRGALGCDPLGALAADGWLPAPLDRCNALMVDLASWTAANAPGMRAVRVSTLPYHAAGATEVQELAFALATGAEYLRQLVAGDLNIEQACSQLQFCFTVGRDVFVQISKLRAARLTWSRLVQACNASGTARRMMLSARTAWRTKTVRDPWVNIVRVTAEGFAAAVAGVDVLLTMPLDEVVGASDQLSHRIARNTQTILRDEAHMARVIDPAGGSWYVEALTRELASRAWELFQQIEAAGGMSSELLRGRIHERIGAAVTKRDHLLATGRRPITGVSEYPDVHEQTSERRYPDLTVLRQRAQSQLQAHLERVDQHLATVALAEQCRLSPPAPGALTAAAIAAASQGATLGRIAALVHGKNPATPRIAPLERRSDAWAFEVLRTASDAYADLRGDRPRVFLAHIGPISQHRARAEFATNLLRAGGFEPLSRDEYDSVDAAVTAFAASSAPGALICATDQHYASVAKPLAARLVQQGAQFVVLAGRPGENEAAYREAGIDHFIFAGCDASAILGALLRQLGAMR